MKIRHIAIFLILLVCLVGAVSAADDVADDTLDVAADDDAVAVDNVQEEVNEKVNEDVSTEPADTAADDTLKVQDNNDELKTGTKTVDVNNFTELTDAINGALSDAENDTYTINLNNCEYKTTTYAIFSTSSPIAKNIMIQGNNQIIDSSSFITFNNVGSNILIKDVTFNSQLRVYASNMTFENAVLQKNVEVDQNSNLTLKNSTITKNLNVNEGKVVISDDCKFQGNALIILLSEEKSEMVISDVYKVVPYLKNFYGDYIIENASFSFGGKQNYGKMTIKDSTIISTNGGQFSNQGGELTIINSTIRASLWNKGKITFINCTIKNSIANYVISGEVGVLNISDDVIFDENVQITGSGEVICNDMNKVLPIMDTYSGNFVLNNITISKDKTNNGNLTINNTLITGKITNYGNLFIDNSTIKASIINEGVLTLGNNVTLDTGFGMSGSGRVFAENINDVFPYLSEFYGEGTVSINTFKKQLTNYGTLTLVDSTIDTMLTNYGNLTIINSSISINSAIKNYGNVTLIGINLDKSLANSYAGGQMIFRNCTLNAKITSGKNGWGIIICDDVIIGPSFSIGGTGEVISNKTELLDYVTTYSGNIVLNNKTIDKVRTNKGTLTLNNCTISSTINNEGTIIIDDDTVFTGAAQITGSGEVIINDISRILPYVSTITGNQIISDKELTKTYTFSGTITLNNCHITSLDNMNYGTLILKNCTVDVGENNAFLTNLQKVQISKDTTINGKIIDLVNGVEYESDTQNQPKTYIVTQDSIKYIIDNNGLNSMIKPGDILDIQGNIILNSSLLINKPVNIISSTNDGLIDLNTTAGNYYGGSRGNSFAINGAGAYTNITGVSFHNTQLWIAGTHHVTLDKVNVVVENQRVGSGVGVTSIREKSSYITVKNSYFHTTENDGSSTLVLAWADYCTIENNTIEGDGFVGNLIYLTTYNVDIPRNIEYNAHNKIINNRLRGPEVVTSTCYGICISGFDNLVDNNTVDYKGSGIMFQWGSGVTGVEQETSLYASGENVVSNNKLYNGCGISVGNVIYNNYMEGTLSVSYGKAYNNTANGLEIGTDAEVTNNTILGKVSFNEGAKDSLVENNTIEGNIKIPATVTNVTLADNDITGTITLDGSYNKLSNNKITTTEDYAVYSNKMGVNNTLTDNYMVANGKVGADAVSLRDESNTIQESTLATKIELTAPGESIVNKTVQVTIKLMDKNGNIINNAQVTVTSSAGSEIVNITNGEAVYQYTPTAIGQDTVAVSYAGNASFYPTANSTTVNVVAEPAKQNQTGNTTPQKPSSDKTPVVSKKATKIVAKKKTFKAKTKIKKYTITLKAGKKLLSKVKVTLKIKGKTYKATTNAKGKATFKIKKLTKKGKYTATIKFAGNKNYKATSAKVKITVKK